MENSFTDIFTQRFNALEEAIGVYGGSSRREPSDKEVDAGFHSAMTDNKANDAVKKLRDDKAAKARAANPDLAAGLTIQPRKRLGEAIGVYGGSSRRENHKEVDAGFHSAMTDNKANDAVKKLQDDKAAKARAANPDLAAGLAIQPKRVKRLGENVTFSAWRQEVFGGLEEAKHPYVEIMPERKTTKKQQVKESFSAEEILSTLAEAEVISTEEELLEFVEYALRLLK